MSDNRVNISSTILRAIKMFGGVQVVSNICSVVLNKLVAVWIGPAGMGLFSSKRFSTSCRLGSALNALEGITAQNEKANKAAHTKDISFFMMKLRRIMSQCKMPVEGKIAYECKARMGFL